MARAEQLPLTQAAAVEATRLRVRGRSWLWTGAAALFLLAAFFTGMLVGPVDLGLAEIGREAASHIPFLGVKSHLSDSDRAILWQLRLPRVVLAGLVGALLSAAGATYQGVFRNPLADPYLLGVAAGAGLGATIAIAYGHGATAFNGDLLPLAAFGGGAIAVVVAYVLGRSAGAGRGPAALVLAGVTVASFLTAVQTFVQQQHSDTLQAVYTWILGRLDTAGWHDVLLLLPYAGVSAAALLLHRRLLDVLTLGDDEAKSLGINVPRVRLVLVAAATLGTAAAVAVSGLIGFLGIIVPHAVRLVAGGSYRIVLPLSIVVGAGFLVFADVIARTAMSPAELPIGVVTAFFGAPFFAIVLRTSRMVGP
jgi:iron complex transport system permease protein